MSSRRVSGLGISLGNFPDQCYRLPGHGPVAGCLAFRAAAFVAARPPVPDDGRSRDYTAFSAYSLDSAMLLSAARYSMTASYVGGSVVLALAAVFLGLIIARALSSKTPRAETWRPKSPASLQNAGERRPVARRANAGRNRRGGRHAPRPLVQAAHPDAGAVASGENLPQGRGAARRQAGRDVDAGRRRRQKCACRRSMSKPPRRLR